MIGFWLARLRGDEAALGRYSATQEALLSALAGKSVAIIGNARSLANSTHGGAIDGADLVIRINTAPMPDAASHGTKTDWLAMSTPVPAARIAALSPDRLLWMTPKRKRLPHRVAATSGFYLHPREQSLALREQLGSSATTGALVIDLIQRSAAAAITLYGFDFFASLSLSGGRRAADVPHDFNAEAAWVTALTDRDDRIRLISS